MQTYQSQFKVISVSSNTNSFGLRGVIITDRSGLAFEVGMNYLSIGEGDNELKTGKTLNVELTVNNNLSSIPGRSYEIPRKLPIVPDKVLKVLFN